MSETGEPVREFFETSIDSRPIYQGRILNLRVDRVRLPDGREAMREIVEHGGAVAAVVIDRSGQVILVKQYRKPPEIALWEIPAGKLEPGEEPETTLWREMQEEIGLEEGRVTHLATFYTTPGFSNELMYLYLIENGRRGESHQAQDEWLISGQFCRARIEHMIEAGEIQDAKSLVGLLLWMRRTREEEEPIR